MTPTITMHPMTDQEYDAYRQLSVPAYAAELERARGISPEAALDESDKAFAKTLAEAAAPERTWVLRVLTSDGEEAGWLWLGPHPHRADGVYVYDIVLPRPTKAVVSAGRRCSRLRSSRGRQACGTSRGTFSAGTAEPKSSTARSVTSPGGRR
jgi:hypothetical protein